MAFPMTTGIMDRLRAGGVRDGDTLLAMLVPISADEARERRKKFGVAQEVDPESEWFRCVYWDEDTRLCGNYESRPHTCSCYPYGNPCEHGCDCDHNWSALDAVG